ncbi:N-acetyltransferase [Rhodococcus rhodnii]|uniref:N-acetyltransferase domain-containing protein n=2 Tax=Rhodococcus rhodnii TaxID=38312 RepID=R7WIU1_9NOCA|nr:GNAT family N-acetyltransferase [Rhodococcus rhodnii]EOM75150.1 hypothetical protein Rrhod_3560 [Rhodococcus rhodnii LMG 5362]TXG89375.1 N-acetyltransferase [Rhodococcus rhodnii]
MSTEDTTEPTVDHATALHRYEVHADGTLAGFTEYVDRDDATKGAQRVFYHTEVDQAFAGRGLAGTLVGRALADTAASGRRIVPVCPYVAKYVESHHDFDEVLDKPTPAALADVRAATGSGS